MSAVLIYLIFVAHLTEFDSRVIANFFACLFPTQNRDFLLEKRYTTHQQNNKTIFCFLVLVIKSMFAIISVVGRRKQACRFHQSFYCISCVGFQSLHN